MTIKLIGVDNLDNSQQYNEATNSALVQSLERNQQSVSKTQQILEAGNAAIAQQAVSIGQASQQKAQANANRGSGIGGLLEGVSKAVGTYWEINQNQQLKQAQIDAKTQVIQREQAEAVARAAEKAAAEAAEANKQQALTVSEQEANAVRVELGDLYNEWRSGDKFRSEPGGMTKFRDAGLARIMSRTNITEAQKKELINLHYGNWDAEMKAYSDRTAKYAEEVSQVRRESVIKERTFRVNSVVSGLTWDADPTDAIKKVDAMVSSTVNDQNLPLLDRLQAANSMYNTAYEKVVNNATARAEVERKMKALQAYQYEAITNWNDQTKPRAEREAFDQQLQAKHGLNVDSSYMAWENSRKQYIEFQQQSRQLQDLEQNGLIDSARKVNLSDDFVGSVVQLILYGEGNTAALKERFTDNRNFEANTAGAGEVRRLLEAVPRMRRETDSLRSDNAALQVARTRLQREGVTFLMNADARTRGLLESFAQQFMVNLPKSNVGLTPEQQAEYARQTNQVQQAIEQQIIINDQRVQNNAAELAKYGLSEPEDVLRKNAATRRKLVNDTMYQLGTQAEQVRRTQTSGYGQLGITSPTTALGEGANRERLTFVAPDGYRRLRPPVVANLATVKFTGSSRNGIVPGSKVMLPFMAADAGRVRVNSDNHREARAKHTHAGEDIAAPGGTKVVSYVSGQVIKVTRQKGIGYGRYITIKGDDGMYHRFAHLSAHNVKQGQRVEAGHVIGLVGDDGSPGSYHLHWEVRDNDGYGANGTVNPLKYMGGVNFKESSAPPPQGNTNGWGYNVNNPPTARVPANAIKLPNGKFLVNNRTGALGNPTARAASEQYTVGRPVNTGKVSGSSWSGTNDYGETYGYAYLANNPEFTKKLAITATRLGISAQWLVDIMAFETGNFKKATNWSHSRTGVVGLIGFTPATARALGTTTYALAKMPPEKQLDYVYKYLSDPQLKPHLSKGVEYVAASIFGGSPLVRKMVNNRSGAMQRGDGDINLQNYLKKLGRDVGRRYDIRSMSRADRLIGSAVHTGFHEGCATCAALRSSGSDIVPHNAEFDA
ncbi:peptidase [Anabaena phage A-4L]|uniref:Internal protein n=1 Tax=Anabaena phage A-4L TaxID=1357732 RepID=A0A059PY91_9CAUD|nr:peptidase [Anabaena phage A-4L]AGR48555.1 internal protein [Anabaena phage A-4L]